MAEAPGASVPITESQFGASGSLTDTLVNVTLPVLVTLIVNVAVPPEITTCVSGVFWMSIAAFLTAVTVSVSSFESVPFADAVATFVTRLRALPPEARILLRFVPQRDAEEVKLTLPTAALTEALDAVATRSATCP